MVDLLEKLDLFVTKKNENISDNNEKEQKAETFCERCQEHTMIKEALGYECHSCGYVGDIIIDHGADWRYYGASDSRAYNPTRTGNIINPLLPKSSMGTYIGGNKYNSIQRLHTWLSMPSKERSLWNIFNKINRLLQNSDILSKVEEESKYYYKMITENDDNLKGILTRGSIRKGLIAACIYVSCKNNGVPKHSKEIADLCNIDENLVTKGLKKFVEIEKRKNLNINSKQTYPDEFISIYCNKLNLSADIKKLCKVICERTIKLGILKNNTPPSIASGVVYLVINKIKLKVSKQQLIDIIKISEVTLNKTYKKLDAYDKYLFMGFEKISL